MNKVKYSFKMIVSKKEGLVVESAINKFLERTLLKKSELTHKVKCVNYEGIKDSLISVDVSGNAKEDSRQLRIWFNNFTDMFANCTESIQGTFNMANSDEEIKLSSEINKAR